MKPQQQIYRHGIDNENGDCFRACIASLLELPTHAVPHFFSKENEERAQRNGEDPHIQVYNYLASYGLAFLFLPWNDHFGYQLEYHGVHHILSGPSPRFPNDSTVAHLVIATGSIIVHDPHPDQRGLALGKDEDYWIEMLAPIDSPYTYPWGDRYDR
jgi:hypothetical protein